MLSSNGMVVMRVIAKAGDYEVVQEMNGLITVHVGHNGQWICDHSSAYEAIRSVPDAAARAELLKQWQADIAAQAHAEKNSKEPEFHA